MNIVCPYGSVSIFLSSCLYNWRKPNLPIWCHSKLVLRNAITFTWFHVILLHNGNQHNFQHNFCNVLAQTSLTSESKAEECIAIRHRRHASKPPRAEELTIRTPDGRRSVQAFPVNDNSCPCWDIITFDYLVNCCLFR